MKRFSRLQTTQPTSGEAVTAVTNCCANCVETSRPQQWGPDLPPLLTKEGDVETNPDAQVSARHKTQIHGPAIYTDNPYSHRHNTTTPLQTLVQVIYPLPTYTTQMDGEAGW